jgi:hydroxyacylglutathione hydrolase
VVALLTLGYAIERFVSDDGFEENTYVLVEKDHRECFIIDPGASAEAVIAYVEREDVHAKTVLATHGHIDHVVSAPTLSKRFNAQFLLNDRDAPLLSSLKQQAALFGYDLRHEVKADGFFAEGSAFHLGSLLIEVLHTPGHTPGSSCFLVGGGDLFTGDTLFAGSIGRTDLPGGSAGDMARSLRRLAALPETIKIHPGHEGVSAIGDEKRLNPFLLPYSKGRI